MKDLSSAIQTYKEYSSIPEWIEDDYEWYIKLGEEEVKWWVDYVDEDCVQLTNDETKDTEEFTPESEQWEEIVEELNTTLPVKSY